MIAHTPYVKGYLSLHPDKYHIILSLGQSQHLVGEKVCVCVRVCVRVCVCVCVRACIKKPAVETSLGKRLPASRDTHRHSTRTN